MPGQIRISMTGLKQALEQALSELADCSDIKIVATEVLRKPRDGRIFAEKLGEEIDRHIVTS